MSEPDDSQASQEEDRLQRQQALRDEIARRADEDERWAEQLRRAAAPDNSPAPDSTFDSDNPAPADLARVKVRGERDDEARHEALARWESFVAADAAANGGMVTPRARPINSNVVRLLDPPQPLPSPSDTEAELNGLIAECRYLIREVACASARLTYDPDDRVRFLASAQSMTLAAAEVGKMVAKLRAASAKTPHLEERRQRITVEHVQSTTQPAIKYASRGEGGTQISADSSHQ